MKTFLKLCSIFILFVAMTSCFTFSYPVSTEKPQNNQTYHIDYLFEHDGCKVYRFYDMGNYVYFTNCRGDVVSIANDSTGHRNTNSIRITYEDYEKAE